MAQYGMTLQQKCKKISTDITGPHQTPNTYQSIIISFVYRHVFYEVPTNIDAQDTVCMNETVTNKESPSIPQGIQLVLWIKICVRSDT